VLRAVDEQRPDVGPFQSQPDPVLITPGQEEELLGDARQPRGLLAGSLYGGREFLPVSSWPAGQLQLAAQHREGGAQLGLAGGASAPLQALLLGGYFGTWVSAAAAVALRFSSEGLAALDASTGVGLIAALPDDACGLAETARVVRYLADESAGQCGPCLFGLDAVAGEFLRLADGSTSDLAALQRWLGQVDGWGACSHPDGTAALIRSAIAAFGPELEQHAHGWCCATRTASVLPVPPRRKR